jgi:hypothetical protein
MGKSDGPEIHIGTLITAPPDFCPDCLVRNIRAEYSWLGGDHYDVVYGRYGCKDCGISWDTGWKVENIG